LPLPPAMPVQLQRAADRPAWRLARGAASRSRLLDRWRLTGPRLDIDPAPYDIRTASHRLAAKHGEGRTPPRALRPSPPLTGRRHASAPLSSIGSRHTPIQWRLFDRAPTQPVAGSSSAAGSHGRPNWLMGNLGNVINQPVPTPRPDTQPR
jgi:hypothetical protein